ncbi:MAG: hypothetical protein KA369_06515 [Spirochaetes bacterium]|nr:hypothetical protein [Spirochaetota bacterium]
MTGLVTLALTVWMNIAPYNFGDVLKDISPDRKGMDAAREISRLLDRTSVRHVSDPETDEFMKYLRSVMEQFDFMKLYESRYFTDNGGGFRALRYQGCTAGDKYHEGIMTRKDGRCALSHAWDYSTEYGLKKNDASVAGARSFIVSVESSTATKSYSHRNVMLFVEGLLKVIDPDNIRNLKAPESPLYPEIEGISRRVINEFNRSFPRVSGLFNRYSVIRSFLDVRSHDNKPYTRLAFRYGYCIANIKEDFPELGKSLENVRGFYRITMVVRNSGNRTVMTVVFDSREDALSLTLCTRRGRLIPIDDTGNPVFTEEISLTSLKDYSYKAVVEMVHDVHGLSFTTDTMVVSFRYRDEPARGSWTMKLEDVSKTRISGSYYHIIPPWMINMFIPSNMEQLIYDLSRVMVKANGGSGSIVSFEWDTGNANNVILRFRALSEFMDNYFMKYALRVWSKKAMSNEKLTGEAKALRGKFIEAFRADMRF